MKKKNMKFKKQSSNSPNKFLMKAPSPTFLLKTRNNLRQCGITENSTISINLAQTLSSKFFKAKDSSLFSSSSPSVTFPQLISC
jgi:hypothetical protein